MPSFALEPPIAKGPGDVVAGDPSGRGKDRLLLGSLGETGPRRQLWLDISGEQVVSILGKRGTGKSYTLGVLIEGLAAGTGKSQLAEVATPRSGLVLDIMDIFWTSQIPLSEGASPEITKQYNSMTTRGFTA